VRNLLFFIFLTLGIVLILYAFPDTRLLLGGTGEFIGKILNETSNPNNRVASNGISSVALIVGICFTAVSLITKIQEVKINSYRIKEEKEKSKKKKR